MSDDRAPLLPAFAAYGIELEYMIVDRERLDVLPIADRLLQQAGRPVTDLVHGNIGWSNELTLHVLELKNVAPVATLDGLAAAFHGQVSIINARLAALGAQLMPGAMHPWMNPRSEARLWPHENAEIYRSFDRIFDCHRHGWANVQSMHLNLPFADDHQFARLHAAIRLVLPILPALAASSPWADGQASGVMDYRLAIYRQHQNRIPSSIGDCIPDPSLSEAAYRRDILDPILREIAAYDPLLGADAGALSHDWVDVRAAAPRFVRKAIEIRVIDIQECPRADLAIAAATTALVRRLYDDKVGTLPPALATPDLLRIFDACIVDAERAVISDAAYLEALGMAPEPCAAGEIWQRIVGALVRDGLLTAHWLAPLQHIARRGTLARRIERALGGDAARLPAVYRELCRCLSEDRLFE